MTPRVPPRTADSPLPGRLRSVRDLTVRLAAPLSAEDCQLQSMADASPTKWHLAHTTWFFETFVLKPHARGYRAFHPQFEYLFNSYYNGIGQQYPRPMRGLVSRPSLAEVLDWRKHVDGALMRLAETPLPPAVAALLELGCNHEQQHQELILTDIKHALALNPLLPAYGQMRRETKSAAPPLRWIAHEGGESSLGDAGDGFAFDNELPRHQVLLRPFELGSRLVTSGEFLEFIGDGGYRRPELWLSDGWACAQAEGWVAPLYWRLDAHAQYTLGGERPIAAAEPVTHVSYYEADAYARWAGARLPREAEWEAVAAGAPATGNFLDVRRLHPAAAARGTGVQQLFGDCWEWTQSAYCAYPGYRPLAGTLGEYNGKFMSGQFVLRGGSCATPPGHVRATYRNFFPPAARWQFSGIRLARDA